MIRHSNHFSKTSKTFDLKQYELRRVSTHFLPTESHLSNDVTLVRTPVLKNV